ncbi:MAG: hypothetical protein EXQ52_15055 [Bryobacterales bacterium]|nr:hypothetical protein [Bryobacterales bacterium]
MLLANDNGAYSVNAAAKLDAVPQAPTSGGDAREWNPAEYIQRTVSAVIQAKHIAHQQGLHICGICATGTTSSIAPMRQLNLQQQPPPIRWDDRRAQAEAACVEELRKNTHTAPWMTVTADSALARALYLSSRFEKELADDIRMIEQLSLFALFWTGIEAIPETIACRKWGFTRNRPWPKEFRDGLIRLYPPSSSPYGAPSSSFPGRFLPTKIVGAGEVVGTILPELASLYRLPWTVRIVSAPFDTLCQVIGLGLLHQQRAAGVSLGTSMGVCALAPSDKSTYYPPYGPLPSVPTPDHGLLFDGLAACGSAERLICEMLGAMKGKEPDYEFIEKSITETKPGSNRVSIVPYFGGGRRAVKCGDPIIQGYQPGRKHDLIRALYESLAYHIRIFIEEFEKVLGFRLDPILVGGGPVRNKGFMQMLADITGRNVVVSSFPDSGLIGCGICGAVGLKWAETFAAASASITRLEPAISPNPQFAKQYSDLYLKYCDQFRDVIGIKSIREQENGA